MEPEEHVDWERVSQAEQLPIHGSLTFKILVIQRDWETVQQLAPSQVDSFHGVSLLTKADRDYLTLEAKKDGVDIQF